MIIKTAEFLISATKSQQYPKLYLPEFAFIGRTNVGKSSLINMLTNRKLLAKISSKPGKTKTLNFFSVNNKWILVDMPGYGYSHTSKNNRKSYEKIITDYLLSRHSLVYLLILIDARHKCLQADIDFIGNCGEMKLPFVTVFTKTDKCSKNELDTNINEYKNKLLEMFTHLPYLFYTSSQTKYGRDKLLSFIFQQAELYSDKITKMKDR